MRMEGKEQTSHRVSGLSGVFSCRFLCDVVSTVSADGMARLSTRHEPMRAVGNGEGMEVRQGAIEIFSEGRGCTGSSPARTGASGTDPLMRDLENLPLAPQAGIARRAPSGIKVVFRDFDRIRKGSMPQLWHVKQATR